MLAVARDNMDLTKYLVSEVRQSMEQRLESLRRFYPQAKAEDWRLEIAGQRVQIIKKDPKKGGVLQFGTELVAARDGSLAALLGAGEEPTAENFPYTITDGKYIWIPYQKVTIDNAADFE